MEHGVSQERPSEEGDHRQYAPLHTLQPELLRGSLWQNVWVIIEVGLEAEAAQSEFVERSETLRRLLVLQVGDVYNLKGEEQLLTDHLMDQRT